MPTENMLLYKIKDDGKIYNLESTFSLSFLCVFFYIGLFENRDIFVGLDPICSKIMILQLIFQEGAIN